MTKYYRIVSYTPFRQEGRVDYIVSDDYNEVVAYAEKCAEENGEMMLDFFHDGEDPIWFMNGCGFWITEIDVKDFRKACED